MRGANSRRMCTIVTGRRHTCFACFVNILFSLQCHRTVLFLQANSLSIRGKGLG